MSSSPQILEIKGNSLDDGPGIRTVVFFKGCPLSCLWCHNPEGQRREAELGFDEESCIGCAACDESCDEGAVRLRAESRVRRSACASCFECVEVCPSGSLKKLGRSMEIDEILRLVRRDIPFFASSGGGVTLSGGEPALFPEFAGALAGGLRESGVHVLLETCGLYDADAFDRHLLSNLDLVFFDLKLADDDEHRRFCGTGNAPIIEHFRALHERTRRGGPSLLPRVPLIPGITATEQNLTLLASLLREIGASRLALLPYNPLWTSKHSALGRAGPLEDERLEGIQGLDRWMTEPELAWCRAHFQGFDLV